MEKEKYINDLREIRMIMSRSSRFLSLSGLSGMSTGLIALVGALLAHQLVFKNHELLVFGVVPIKEESLHTLLLIALGTIMLSILSALWFTRRKSKKENQHAWDLQAKRLLINLLIPLTTGGILCLIFLLKGYVGLLPAMTLIFYGLALINGSHHTLSHIRYLGMADIALGIVALLFIEQSLYVWMVGFGVLQIIYGLMIQRKG